MSVVDASAEVRVLSMKEPWLWAVLHCGKRIENRRNNWRYRGRVLLQRSGTCSDAYYRDALRWMFARDLIDPLTVPSREELLTKTMGIVARAHIEHAVDPLDGSDALRLHGGDPYPIGFDRNWHMTDRHGYALKDVEELPFIPCRGYLGLFRPPPAVLAAVAAHDAKRALP